MSVIGRVAVALFVRNEQADIASWIAWHAAIGVQKFYIYDDHSDDETYAIIEVAARLFDIELEKTDRVGQPDFYWRQRDSYLSACRKASGREEWLAMLDGDEYINIMDAPSISAFVAPFQAFNAIALNWRIFGSSGRALQEKESPVAVFKAHSSIDFPDNSLVKSLIRPEQYSYDYRDPHRLIMQNETYADALGRRFEWKNSTKSPVWEGAVINHYVCRSMESYVRRIRRRIDADLRNSTAYWAHFDRNEHYSPTRDDFVAKADRHVAAIRSACLSLAIETFATTYAEMGSMAWHPKDGPLSEQAAPQSVAITKEGHFLEIDQFSRFVSLGSAPAARVQGLFDHQSSRMWLFRARFGVLLTDKFKIKDDPRFDYAYEFRVERATDGIYLRSPLTGLYLCAVPNSEENGGIYCNSPNALGWEKFELTSLDDDLNFMSRSVDDPNYASIFEFMTRYGTRIQPNDLILATASLPDRVQTLSFLKRLAPVEWIF